MRCLVLSLILSLFVFGCDNTKDSSNVTDASAENTAVQEEEEFSKADYLRVNEILESLRNPKFELNIERASGPNTSLGLGIREGEITNYHDLIVNYKDAEIQNYSDMLADELIAIYKHAKYRQVLNEIYRLYIIIGDDFAKQAMLNHCLDIELQDESRRWSMVLLARVFHNNADDKSLNSMIPLLYDKDEEIRIDCINIFKNTNAKIALSNLFRRFRDDAVSKIEKLHIIRAICVIDKKYQKMGAKYANEIYINSKAKKDSDIHYLALKVASDINDDSTLEMMLSFTKDGTYTEKFLDSLIYPLAKYQRDVRVQKLFFNILVSSSFGEEIKMSVLNNYSTVGEKSKKLIRDMIDENIKESYCLFSIAKSGINALGSIGDEETIKYLLDLKEKYDGYDVDIDEAISMIEHR